MHLYVAASLPNKLGMESLNKYINKKGFWVLTMKWMQSVSNNEELVTKIHAYITFSKIKYKNIK